MPKAEPVKIGARLTGRAFSLPGGKLLWALLLLAALVLWLPYSQAFFASLFPALDRPVYTQEPFAQLLWQHVVLVGVSSAFSVAVGSVLQN